MSLVKKIIFFCKKMFKSNEQENKEKLDGLYVFELAKKEQMDAILIQNEMCEYHECFSEAMIEIEEKKLCPTHAKIMIELISTK